MMRNRLFAPALFGFCWLAGCADDQIERYRVPKVATVDPPFKTQDSNPQRLLAAIIARGERTWFFKLAGPASHVDEQKDTFDQFIRSVRFTDSADKPVVWDSPEGWVEEPGKELRYATLRHSHGDEGIELTVTPLSGEAGSLIGNVNRWRDQIGLPPIPESQLANVATREKRDGLGEVVIVNMVGPGKAGPGLKGPMAGGQAPFAPFAGEAGSAPSVPQLVYRLPDGWTKLPRTDQMRIAAFRVSEGDRQVDITVFAFPGAAGGFGPNINRWREQVGLGPASDEDLLKSSREIDAAGGKARVVDLIGPDSAGENRERIIGAVLSHGELTWFFKMRGPAELVARQKDNFESFVRSIKLQAGGDAEGGSNG